MGTLSVKRGPDQASICDELGVRTRWNILWYIVLSEFTWLLSCYTAPQPCPHIQSFCFSFCLKISPSLNFCLPAAQWSTHFAALSLKLFQGTSVRCVRPWRPLSLWHSTNSHQSGHMITEQYVTPPSPERPVLKSPDLCHKLKPQVIYSSFIYSMSCKSPFYWLMKYKILLISFWNVNLWKLLSSFQLESVSVYSEPKAGCGLWLMHVWITT